MTVFKFNTESAAPPPATLEPRKGEGELGDEELQTLMNGIIADAEQLVDNELSPERAKATDYFNGEPFGNEEEGRSQFVMTVVRDVIRGMAPSIMRVLFGPDRVVEYSARLPFGADPQRMRLAVAQAQQATDYAQYVFVEQNQGFTQTHSVLMDGMVKKLGIFKWWWETTSRRMYRQEEMSDEELTMLAARDDVRILKRVPVGEAGGYGASEAPESQPQADAQPGAEQPTPDQQRYTVDYMMTPPGHLCIKALPPEEFIISRGAHDLDDALMVGHRTELTRGELLAMGIDEDLLDEDGDRDVDLEQNPEAIERQTNFNQTLGLDPDAGDGNDKIKYIEAYPYLDLYGTGEPVLCKVCMVGPQNKVALPPEPTDERPFALFTPIPEPHAVIGQSVADLTMDLQLVKSMVVRSMFDSLALSIYPRVAFVEGLVNVEDLLNNAIGNPIRMKKEGAAVPFTHPFTGEAALPIVDMLDQIEENRTGRDKGSMGLDADALQSSTAQGVERILAASQEQIEYIIRLFAEQTMKPMFKGIYRALVKYKPQQQLVRLRGMYVPIDVAQWEPEMDVVVSVGLGTTNVDKKLSALAGVKAAQEMVLSTLGPANPLVSLSQYSNTLLRMTALAGFQNATDFFSPVDPSWQPPQQAPQLTPEQTIAQAQIQIEQMKAQKDVAIKQAQMQLQEQKQMFEQELEIRKLAQDFTLRRYQIDAQFKADFTQANLDADAAADEAALKGAMNVASMRHDQAMAARKQAADEQAQAHAQSLAEDQQAHDQDIAQQQVDNQATPDAETE